MRRLLSVVLAFVLVAAVARGGETIRVVACNHPWAEGMKALVADFEKETGIKVQVEQYGEDQLMQKLAVEFTAGGSTIDVFMTRPQNDARLYIKNGWLADLTPYVENDADYDFSDYTEGSIVSTKINGFQSSIPVVTEVEVLYYRKDLLEKKGVQVPTTFEELEEAAKILDDKQNEIAGFMARGQRSPLVTVFSNYLFSYGGDFYNKETMTSMVDTPEFLAAAEFYGRMLRNYGPPGVLNMSWPQGCAIFAQGKAAMYTEASSSYPNMLDPAKSKVADLTEVAMFPRGPVAHKCFDVTAWGLSMPTNAPHKDAAWKFIRYMTNKENTIIIQGKYANQCARKSAFADPRGIENFPKSWVKAVQDSAAIGVGYDRPLITQVGEARDIIGQVITDAIENKDYKASAKTAHAKFQVLLDREKADAK